MITALILLLREVAAFVNHTDVFVTAASVNIIGLLSVTIDKFRNIPVMIVTGHQIESVEGIDAGGHIDITSTGAYSNLTLSCNVIAMERMLRIRHVNWKITYIGKICREHNIKFHTDATQSYLKHTIDVNAMNIDYLSVSGHKVGAPKGIGFLYTRSPITPMIRGGIQENGMRAGTENVPYIIGLAEAVNRWNNIDRHLHFYNLAYVAYNKLEEIDGVSFNGDFSSDSIISMTIENCDAMQLMICLDDCGVCVSTGSACSHGSPSHVLKAIGCKDIENTIRISFGLTTTIEEVETGMDIIIRCIKQIRGY